MSRICLLSYPPRLTLRTNSSHWTCLGIQFYTSPIALTRGIYLSLCGGTTLETRGKIFKVHTSYFVGHGTVIWLVCGMKSTVCLCRRRTHAEMSHPLLHSWKLAGNLVLKSRSRYQQVTLLGITSYPFIHKYPGLPAGALATFLDRLLVVSQSRVKVCALFLSVCQVLRALVHSVLTWLVWCGVVGP